METTGDAAIESKTGTVEFNAAKNTSSSKGLAVEGSLSSDEMGSYSSAEVKANTSDESTEVAGTLKAGGNLSVKADKKVTFVGTDVEAGNEIDVQGKEGIDTLATTNTKQSLSGELSVDDTVGDPTSQGGSSTDFGVNLSGEDSVSHKGATFKSGGRNKDED
nr:hemagglutinin repeat-containing protein [Desulfobulbaceae bacterium]